MLKEYRTVWKHIRRHRSAYITGLLFLILTDAGQILIPRFIGRAVDLIADGQGLTGAVGRLMMLVIILAAFVALGRYGWRNFIVGSSRRIEAELRNRIYNKLLILTDSFYASRKTGDLMARATNDLTSVRMSLGMGLIAFVDGVFMSLVILITLFMSYGRVGLLIVLPLPLLTVLALVLGRLLGPLFFKVQEHYARISDHVQETLSGIRVVKSFVKEKKTLDDFSLINAEYGRANMNLARFWGFMFPAMHFLAGLGVLLLLYFGGRHVLADTLSYGDFVAMLAYLGMLIWPAMGAGWVVNMLQRGAASMKRINSVLDEVPDITDMDAAVDVPPVGGLEFRSVCYAYKSNDKVLKNISFTVPEGRAMGILGRTGSGKTTLVKLIPRLLDPPPDSIFIGSRDIRTFTRSALRQSLGIVPQDIFLFSTSIRENVVFARPEASRDEVDKAVHIAGLEKDMPWFPNGLETLVGEKGVTLSGGQKQRIAIARAIIADPSVLVLDDALSAVDADTEERILEGLFELRKEKTTLMISHRVSALARCDNCIVLEDGKVTAMGTHNELLASKGLYRRIADLQKLESEGSQ